MKKSDSKIIVNLEAISNNLGVLQSYAASGVQQMAVVKANAYGHGAVRVAGAIAEQVAWFAVNDIEEAIELREGGIENPILVFGVPEQNEANRYKEHQITATISSFEHFRFLASGTEYHLNFDTGMGRLGFRPQLVDGIKKAVDKHPELTCSGIYSHFATADEPGSGKVKQQLQVFKDIRARFPPDLLTHMCNTAGTIQCSDAHFDLVRNGIGMYGYSPGETNIPKLEPALSWKTKIIQVNRVKKGEAVSYGATWKAEEDGFIGIIPVGYSNGIPRGLSGDFSVMIEGKRYPVVGTVTMNYCMVYLGEKPLKPGATVELLNGAITAKDWAKRIGTISYEILTGLSDKIPRTYISD